MKRFGILLFSILLLFFAVGCSKDKGWKAQSAVNISSQSSGEDKPIKDSRPTSVSAGSILHDLFGAQLPADTDRYLLPAVSEEQRFPMSDYVHEADVYGGTMYFIRLHEKNVYSYDFDTLEERVFAEGLSNPAAICTDADGVYVADVGTKEIVYFTFDGAKAGSVSPPENPKDNTGGPEGYAWMLEKYYAALRHYDGLLLLAARDAVWTIADGETEWRRAEYPFISREVVSCAAIVSRNRIAIFTQRSVVGARKYTRVTEMDRDGGNEKLLYEDSVQAMCANGGRLYITAGRDGATRLYELSDGQAVFIQTAGKGGLDAIVHFAVSNGTMFIEWVSKKVDLIPVADDAETVRFLTPNRKRCWPRRSWTARQARPSGISPIRTRHSSTRSARPSCSAERISILPLSPVRKSRSQRCSVPSCRAGRRPISAETRSSPRISTKRIRD